MAPTAPLSIDVPLLAGHARMSGGLRRRLAILRAPPADDIGATLRNIDAIASFASLIEKKIAEVRTLDGRVDMTDLAHAILASARPSSAVQARVRAIEGDRTADALAGAIDDAVAAHSLSLVLTEAIGIHQRPGTGAIDYQDVAAHVLAEMRRNQR